MVGLFDIISLILFGGPTSEEMEQAEIDVENARVSGDKKKIVRATLVYILGVLTFVSGVAWLVFAFFE
ncbi:hypothetical protein C1879_04245 [Paraeggerthella hongkongensis]|uniref:hypothetical protein n=1 Tax=Paraeggerthella sp. TaxID=2897350 RepID=UPI000DF7C60E|nr:hypothetical protein C1879_04245 [Paraeggerthella hongkongensis]